MVEFEQLVAKIREIIPKPPKVTEIRNSSESTELDNDKSTSSNDNHSVKQNSNTGSQNNDSDQKSNPPGKKSSLCTLL